MASPVSSISTGCILFSVVLFVLCTHALTEGEHHTVHISSLLPASACTYSTQGQRNGASLKIVHRHGPCSHLTLNKTKIPTATQFLTQDQSRVNSIQSRFAFNSGQTTLKTSQATIPAKSGSSLGSGIAGLLGLGRNSLSIVSQTASKYGKYFSYCLPTSSSTGYLTFGNDGKSKLLKFTPLLINSQGSSFYFIDIVAIKCGATLISIPQAIFKTAGTIIDSGTVITRLPPTAYSALRTEFRKQMAKYPSAPQMSILDTCYNLSNYTTVTIPVVTFYFGGNIQVPIDAQGTLYGGGGISQICLAFAANSDDTALGIFGNFQQQTMDVVYDVAGGKLGFGLKGCS